MTELERARGGKDIRDRFALSNEAYLWLSRQENPETIHRMEYAQDLIKDLFEGQNFEITVEKDDILDPMFYTQASIVVTARDFLIHDPGAFAKLGKICSSICFRPRTDGCLALVFYFDNLVEKVGI